MIQEFCYHCPLKKMIKTQKRFIKVETGIVSKTDRNG